MVKIYKDNNRGCWDNKPDRPTALKKHVRNVSYEEVTNELECDEKAYEKMREKRSLCREWK